MSFNIKIIKTVKTGGSEILDTPGYPDVIAELHNCYYGKWAGTITERINGVKGEYVKYVWYGSKIDCHQHILAYLDAIKAVA